VDVLFAKSLRPHPRPFPLRGREASRTSDSCSQCGGILLLKGELEGVYDRSHITGVEGKLLNNYSAD